MIRMLISAPASGSGKTAVTCALLAAMQKRGLFPRAFKCGPDYIDPMFHRTVLGVESSNLDLFLSDEETLRARFARGLAGHGAVVCEGVMGLYDGVGGVTDRASAWHVADTLDLPVILVLRAKGSSLTLAAQLRGLRDFRPDSHIAGVLLNDCAPMLCRSLRPMLERETGIPVLGCLPHLKEAEFESRHLGLYTPAEIQDLAERLTVLAEALERYVDVERLLGLCDDGTAARAWPAEAARGVPIAVARDKAFCFTYPETLEALERAGARPAFFSPLEDRGLPAGACGLYLPGGYPELYAEALSANEPMRRAVAEAVRSGMPTVAECGGFLYLGKTLQDAGGAEWPMADVLPGRGFPAGKLVRFGYGTLRAESDSLLFRKGEQVPVHEFHYWDSTETGGDLRMEKPVSGQTWECGFVTDTLYAAFPHLYFAGTPRLAERLTEAARKYKESHDGTGDAAEKHRT